MTHTYGSHVLRSLLEILGGVAIKGDIVRSRASRYQSKTFLLMIFLRIWMLEF